jgi:hypothetical protein
VAGSGPETFSRAKDVLAERVYDETLIFDLTSHRSTRLNLSGSLLWETLEQPCTLAALAERLEGAFGLDRETAHADAATFVDELTSRRLIAGDRG